LLALGLLAAAPKPALSQVDSVFQPQVVETVTVVKPLVLAFFPPVTQAQVDSDESLSEALSHVEFAMDDARHCLPRDSVDVDIAFATTLVVIDGPRTSTLVLEPRSFPLGAYILFPAQPPRLVRAPVGPSSLIPMIWQATAEAFQRPACNKMNN
jgi:hypothetical protein